MHALTKVKSDYTLAGLELSLFTKLILPNVVQMFSRNASSLLQGTECKSEAKFSGGALKRVSRFMWLLNSATDEKFEI